MTIPQASPRKAIPFVNRLCPERVGCNVHGRSTRGFTFGFTLVELLVVIGIVALLIGILLPSLAAARESAKRIACGSKLHQMMIAANIHVVDHKGYYPICGQINGNVGAPMLSPASISDYYTDHYTWMQFNQLAQYTGGDLRCLAPIHWALAGEMGFRKALESLTDAQMGTFGSDPTGLIRNFLCPSQAATVDEFHQLCFMYGGAASNSVLLGWVDTLSYVFNEAVLGYDDSFTRLRGQASRVKQPSKTMFACDGLGGSTSSRLITAEFASINNPPPQYPPPWPFLTMYNNVANYAPITLSDVLTGKSGGPGNHRLAGDPSNFDQIRHKGKMNIAFCDGHVELRDIPAFKINAQGTAATMTYDPTAKGLKDVYLVAN